MNATSQIPILSVFISHSSRDDALAAALVLLLQKALKLDNEQIRCTSVKGFKLPIGQNMDEVIRRELLDCQLFIGLITPNSLRSEYVLFELAARWGAGKRVIPVLALGATYDAIPSPIQRLTALDFGKDGEIENLISSASTILNKRTTNLSNFSDQIAEVRRLSSNKSASDILRENTYALLCRASYVSSSVMQSPNGRNHMFDIWRAYNDPQALTIFWEWLSVCIPHDASCVVAIGRSGLPPAVFAALSRKIPFYCVYKPTRCVQCGAVTHTSSTKLVNEASTAELANAVIVDNSINSGDSILFALEMIFGKNGNVEKTLVLVDHDLDDERTVAKRSSLRTFRVGYDFTPESLVKDSILRERKRRAGE